jgi:hypothetical protein
MAIDTDFEEDDEGGEDAKGLRAQLGKLGKSNKAMAEKLARYEVRDMLTTKGFDLVEPEELIAVSDTDRERRAEELQGQRQKQQETLLRKALEKVGVTADNDDALEDLVQELLGKRDAESDTAEHVGRARELSRLESNPVPHVDPRKLHGEEAISYGLSQPQAKRR